MTRSKSNKRSFEPDESINKNYHSKKQKLQHSPGGNVTKSRRRRRGTSQQRRVVTRATEICQQNLRSVFRHVLLLREYLMELCAFNAKGLAGSESKELGKFLDTTLVGVDDFKPGRNFLISKYGMLLTEMDPSHTELITMVIEDQFKHSRYPDHVLTYGFESTDHSVNFGTNVSMANFNSQVEELQGDIWKDLLEITGPAVVYFLMAHVSLFRKLPSNGLLQLTGPSVEKAIKSKPVPEVKQAYESSICLKRASQIALAKVSVVYASPFFFSAERKVRYGLRPQRKLSALVPMFTFLTFLRSLECTIELLEADIRPEGSHECSSEVFLTVHVPGPIQTAFSFVWSFFATAK